MNAPEVFNEKPIADRSNLSRLLAVLLLSLNAGGPTPLHPSSAFGKGINFGVSRRYSRPFVLPAMKVVSKPLESNVGSDFRRTMLQAGSGILSTLGLPVVARASDSAGSRVNSKGLRRYWPLLQGPFDFPSAARATVRRELIPGRMWSFEQVQGVIYVQVPVRMTVVRLDSGGLFVYAPVAPTSECLNLLKEVETEFGPVKHILLPTLAIEHKDFAGAFANARPKAQLWVAPAQYSFPVDLPLPLQGFPANVKILPAEAEASSVPWASQLPYRTLPALRETAGAFQEVVLFDRSTDTLLVTDLVLSLPSEPPDISATNDLRALLYHARDDASQTPVDSPETRAEGWKKICLFALYFQSSALSVPNEPDGSLGTSLRFLSSAFPREMPKSARDLGWLGFFAWRWLPTWPKVFERTRNGGKPFIPPILQEIVLARDPEIVATFAKRVADDFNFTSIVPAHFDATIKAGPQDWLDAFRIFEPNGGEYALPAEDTKFLRNFEKLLVEQGTIRPRPARV